MHAQWQCHGWSAALRLLRRAENSTNCISCLHFVFCIFNARLFSCLETTARAIASAKVGSTADSQRLYTPIVCKRKAHWLIPAAVACWSLMTLLLCDAFEVSASEQCLHVVGYSIISTALRVRMYFGDQDRHTTTNRFSPKRRAAKANRSSADSWRAVGRWPVG